MISVTYGVGRAWGRRERVRGTPGQPERVEVPEAYQRAQPNPSILVPRRLSESALMPTSLRSCRSGGGFANPRSYDVVVLLNGSTGNAIYPLSREAIPLRLVLLRRGGHISNYQYGSVTLWGCCA